MHSFTAVAWMVMGVGSVRGRALLAPMPVVTPGPSVSNVQDIAKRQLPDPISLARVLLTAIPQELRQIAATDIPAVSSMLDQEFRGGKTPAWFLELPPDIQTYLIEQFGPAATALPSPTAPVWWTPPAEVSSWPGETGPGWSEEPVQTSASEPAETNASQPAETDPSQSSEPSQTTGPVESETTSASSESTSGTSSATESTESTGTPSRTATESGSSSTDSSSATSIPAAPEVDSSNDPGLSTKQKIGIGLGVPFAIAGVAALAFGFCFLLRRRQRKKVIGSVPPSSPGFIPRFAFQESPPQDPDQRPLNPSSSFADLHNMTWDDEVIDTSSSGESVPTLNTAHPIMAPALYHTHSSNRARGKRTSYTSLHSVAEVSEPDDMESPILGRNDPAHGGLIRPGINPKRHTPPRAIIPPPSPTGSMIKRKPVPVITTPNPTAHLASQTLLHQTMPEHSQPLPSRYRAGHHRRSSSNLSPYVSPIEEHRPRDVFSNPNSNPSYSYEEDYGPEYSNATRKNGMRRNSHNSDFIDIEEGLYGNAGLSRYPSPMQQTGARTEWPLRNFEGKRGGKSPLWDRVYDGSNG